MPTEQTTAVPTRHTFHPYVVLTERADGHYDVTTDWSSIWLSSYADGVELPEEDERVQAAQAALDAQLEVSDLALPAIICAQTPGVDWDAVHVALDRVADGEHDADWGLDRIRNLVTSALNNSN